MLVYAGFSNVVVGLIVLIEVLAGNFFFTDGARWRGREAHTTVIYSHDCDTTQVNDRQRYLYLYITTRKEVGMALV